MDFEDFKPFLYAIAIVVLMFIFISLACYWGANTASHRFSYSCDGIDTGVCDEGRITSSGVVHITGCDNGNEYVCQTIVEHRR